MSTTGWTRAAKTTSASALIAWSIGCGGGASSGATTTTTTDTTAGGTTTTAPASEHAVPDVTRAVTVPHGMSAPSGHALVVFMCPADCTPFAIVDASGALVGEIASHDRATLEVAAGAVTFYAVSETASDRISGEVTAGGVYYAAINAHSAGQRFATIAPHNPDGRWEHVAEYLTDTHEKEIDSARRGELEARIVNSQLRTLMTELDARVAEMDATHRDERTIHAEDGSQIPPGVH
jgi:hypothetical protein